MPRRPKPSPVPSVLVPVLLRLARFSERTEPDFASECRKALAASALRDPTRRADAMERLASVTLLLLERDRADERRQQSVAPAGRDT